MSPGTNLVVADLLEEKLKTGIKKQADHYEVTRLTSHLVLAHMRLMQEMQEKLWGNGVPGGLVQDMAVMKDRVARMYDMIDKISEQTTKMQQYNIAIDASQAASERKQATENKDTFGLALKWFNDKVLPSLVTVTILAAGQLLLFMIALQNGWIKIPAP